MNTWEKPIINIIDINKTNTKASGDNSDTADTPDS